MYYAIAARNKIQFDLDTNLLEIYETESAAEQACPANCEVVEVIVKHKKSPGE